MFILLFHVICLVGKYIYEKYQTEGKRTVYDDMASDGNSKPSYDSFRMVDPEVDYTDSTEDAEKNLRFHPPAYVQRYCAVADVLNDPKYGGNLRKIVDFGCSEMNFVNRLKNVPGVEEILCVDIDGLLLEVHKHKAEPLISEYLSCRTSPLVIEVCQGSVTDNDKKLENTDAVVCIELIEHLYADTLNKFPLNVFGFIKPQVVIVTTPNADFNVLFPNFSGFRHYDHKFEWTRQQFQDWAENIVSRYSEYEVTFQGICYGPKGTEHLGACSQMAIFNRICDIRSNSPSVEGLFKTIATYDYPCRVDNRSDEQKILDEATYYLRQLSFQNDDMQDEVPLCRLLERLQAFSIGMESLRVILQESGLSIEDRENGPVVLLPQLSSESEFTEDEIDESSFNAGDEDNWDMGIGPINDNTPNHFHEPDLDEDWNTSNNFQESDPTEEWNSSSNFQEPDTIEEWGPSWLEPGLNSSEINYTTEDFPHSLNGLNNSSYLQPNTDCMEDYEPHLQDTGIPEHPCYDIKDISTNPALPNILNSTNFDSSQQSFNYDSTDFSDSFTMSAASLSTTAESSQYDCANNSSCTDANTVSKLNRMLDFQSRTSTSQSHTSPEPSPVEDAQMNQSFRESNFNSQSMSDSSWMLSNMFRVSDTSKDTESSMEANTAQKSGIIHEEDELLDEEFEELHNVPMKNTGSLMHQPQFTSSPKIRTKVTESKRRSAESSKNSRSEETSEGSKLLVDDTRLDKETKTLNIPQEESHITNTLQSSSGNTKEACGSSESSVTNVTKSVAELEIAEELRDSLAPSFKCNIIDRSLSPLEIVENLNTKLSSPETIATSPDSWSPGVVDSGYPYSVSTQDISPEYDVLSIPQDESPDAVELPPLPVIDAQEVVEVVQVDNGDLANNNRDDEGNNMKAEAGNVLDDLLPLIDGLDHDRENENDIYVLENDFPLWLLRMLERVDQIDDERLDEDLRHLAIPDDAPAGNVAYDDSDHDDEGVNSVSLEEEIAEDYEIPNEDNNNFNENAISDISEQ